MDPASQDLSLGDLLDEEDLDLTMLIGKPEDRDRPLAGAHVVELPHPAAWVDRDWLVLTSGMPFQDGTSAEAVARTMVEELTQAGVSALAFGLEPVFSEVPEPLVAAAKAAELPVISVPKQTSFRVLVARVYRATLSEDVRAARRLISMQRYLMNALGDEHPTQTAVERLAGLIDGVAALLTREGNLDTATEDVPTEEIWEVIVNRPATTVVVPVRDRTWVAVPLVVRTGIVHRWLLASSTEASLHVVRTAAQAALPLLTAINRMQSIQKQQERAASRVLFEDLISDAPDPVSLAQLQDQGIDFSRDVTVLALHSDRAGEHLDELEALEDELTQAALPAVTAARETALAAAVQASPEELGSLAGRLVERLDSDTGIGLGSPARDPEEVRRSLREAELAAQQSLSEGVGVQRFSEVPFPLAVLSGVPLDRVRERSEAFRDKLSDQAHAIETLRAYFESGLNVTVTARQLHLHPNSLRYRLAKIEDQIGGSFQDPVVISTVFLALRSWPREPATNDS